jgi:hypothetical protein
MCIESPSISAEFPHPATTNNVESAKNFKLWMELNFLKPWNFCRWRSIVTDTPGVGGVSAETRRDTMQLKLIPMRYATGTGRVPGRSDEGGAAGADPRLCRR